MVRAVASFFDASVMHRELRASTWQHGGPNRSPQAPKGSPSPNLHPAAHTPISFRIPEGLAKTVYLHNIHGVDSQIRAFGFQELAPHTTSTPLELYKPIHAAWPEYFEYSSMCRQEIHSHTASRTFNSRLHSLRIPAPPQGLRDRGQLLCFYSFDLGSIMLPKLSSLRPQTGDFPEP